MQKLEEIKIEFDCDMCFKTTTMGYHLSDVAYLILDIIKKLKEQKTCICMQCEIRDN